MATLTCLPGPPAVGTRTLTFPSTGTPPFPKPLLQRRPRIAHARRPGRRVDDDDEVVGRANAAETTWTPSGSGSSRWTIAASDSAAAARFASSLERRQLRARTGV